MSDKTLLYQLHETETFMMSFVLVTKENNVVIIDGGRPCDMPRLKECVAGRHVSAWILTHPHSDHISGFLSEMKKNDCADFDLERVVYRFPPYEEWRKKTEADVPDIAFFRIETEEVLAEFTALLPRFSHLACEIAQGDSITVDECRFDFIYAFREGLYANPMNDASLVFRVTAPNKTVLFLGDLGPEGGDALFYESRHLLKADIVQMAHHGHMGVGMEVYAAIQPEACLWCCQDWLYDEVEMPVWLDTPKWWTAGKRRMYGTQVTRKWMDALGVKTHYVTKDGTQIIEL